MKLATVFESVGGGARASGSQFSGIDLIGRHTIAKTDNFDVSYSPGARHYDVAPDGRFLMIKASREAAFRD